MYSELSKKPKRSKMKKFKNRQRRKHSEPRTALSGGARTSWMSLCLLVLLSSSLAAEIATMAKTPKIGPTAPEVEKRRLLGKKGGGRAVGRRITQLEELQPLIIHVDTHHLSSIATKVKDGKFTSKTPRERDFNVLALIFNNKLKPKKN